MKFRPATVRERAIELSMIKKRKGKKWKEIKMMKDSNVAHYGIGFSKASINQSARNSGQTDGNVQHFHGGCGRVIRLKINSIHSTSGILSLSLSLSRCSVYLAFLVAGARGNQSASLLFIPDCMNRVCDR